MALRGARRDTPEPVRVELQGVTVAYGDQVAVREVDMTIEPGTVTALLGANGAGKTTLLKAAAGLLPIASGQVLVDGSDVTRWAPHRRVRAGLCLVPEGRGIFPSLSVRENLLLQLPQGGGNRDLDAALEAFPQLADRLGQIAGTMSGGQQQMLALARCYLARPAAILLDEVSMGLAPLVVDEIFQSIVTLAAGGVGILLVEQYIDRALEIATAAYLLSRGTVAFSGLANKLESEAVVKDYLGTGGDVPAPMKAGSSTVQLEEERR